MTIALLSLFVGFGRAGVRAGKFLDVVLLYILIYIGSPASMFQSQRYGGYTPRGGIFASLTSARMRGTTPAIYKVAGVLVASLVVVVMYRALARK